MEADWSVELGPDADVIDPLWHGLVDLLTSPHRISEIEEAVAFPPLAEALLQINEEAMEAAPSNAFWTAKCDLWELQDASENLDPDEFNAEAGQTQAAIACYIDLLPRSLPTPASPSPTRLLFATWHNAEQSAKALALALRTSPLTCARADLIIRSAITPDHHGYGITAYLTACGPDHPTASKTLASALTLFTETLKTFPHLHFAENPIPLQ